MLKHGLRGMRNRKFHPDVRLTSAHVCADMALKNGSVLKTQWLF